VLVHLEPVREHAEDEEEHGETYDVCELRTPTECSGHRPKSMIADITLAAYQISPASGDTSLCAGRLKHTSVYLTFKSGETLHLLRPGTKVDERECREAGWPAGDERAVCLVTCISRQTRSHHLTDDSPSKNPVVMTRMT
jgi:hypothetical protein